jgi:hypothetical protein
MDSTDVFYLKIEAYLKGMAPSMEFVPVASLANDTALFITLVKELILYKKMYEIEFNKDYSGIRKLPPLPDWKDNHYKPKNK